MPCQLGLIIHCVFCRDDRQLSPNVASGYVRIVANTRRIRDGVWRSEDQGLTASDQQIPINLRFTQQRHLCAGSNVILQVGINVKRLGPTFNDLAIDYHFFRPFLGR